MARLIIRSAVPGQELAAHPDTLPVLHRLLQPYRQQPAAAPATARALGAGWPELPLVLDDTVDRGEVHLRPVRPGPA
ncbi:hypothetical protein JL475_24435 [Streptomyces sp. M2CJ-2]|uniref:hypothetical protein n=1 Tax=Streptomyces sp. M2CJ-2 TaxID=2803948 RepID=UPI0019262881|nr:hypothetical protein [Streptomyces sp. M2CJ-2]MBL3669084.1 hypothetical protein [Streptomyces sp. M2CJ-2]